MNTKFSETDLGCLIGDEWGLFGNRIRREKDGLHLVENGEHDSCWFHPEPENPVLPFPFTLEQFRAFCDWHPTFQWEAIESVFTNDDGSLDDAAIDRLNPASGAADLVRAVLATHDAEFQLAWRIHEQLDQCKAQIQRWERLEQNAPTPSEAITAEGKLASLRAELAGLLNQLSGAAQVHPEATVSQPQAAPDTTPASAEQVESDQRPAEQSEVGVAHHAEPIPASAPAIATNVEPPIADELVEQPVQASPDWCVRKPKRGGGYRESLYRFLLAAWNAGKPRPTARDFLEACRVNQSIEIAKVLPDSIDYYDGNGDTKPANLEAIRKAIERMAVGR